MIKNLKTILILLYCLLITVLFTSGCFSSTSDSGLIVMDKAKNTDDTENTIDDMLSGFRDRLVTAPVILSHSSGEEIYSSGEKELVFIKGLADKGNTIEIYVNGSLQQEDITVDSSGDFETSNGVEIIEGANVLEVVSVSPSGNESNPTVLDLILVVPQKVEYTLYNNSTDMEEIQSAYYSLENKPLVYIQGTHLPSSQVYIQANDRVVGEATCNDAGIFELDGIQLKSGNNEIAVWAETEDGHMSAPFFKEVVVFKDLITPDPCELTGYQQGSANYLSWTQSSDVNFSSYKLVRLEDPCADPDLASDDVIATFSDISAGSYVDEDTEEYKSYYYSVWTVDESGRDVASNTLAVPAPDYTVSMEQVPPFSDISLSRREAYYKYYEITNLGNVTLDLQPMIVYLKLDPNPDAEMEIAPLWAVYIWNPEDAVEPYYEEKEIYETYISDFANTSGYTDVEEETVDTDTDADGFYDTRVVTVTETYTITAESDVNLKRIMTTSVTKTVTKYSLSTGAITEGPTVETEPDSTEIVEPEQIGSLIEGLEPGEKKKIAIKIQNVSAAWEEKITVHFHFAPVDCDGRYFVDEIVSTDDITVKSVGRNYQ